LVVTLGLIPLALFMKDTAELIPSDCLQGRLADLPEQGQRRFVGLSGLGVLSGGTERLAEFSMQHAAQALDALAGSQPARDCQGFSQPCGG
jgi:hypothetical protein